jgi:hypothetical protein
MATRRFRVTVEELPPNTGQFREGFLLFDLDKNPMTNEQIVRVIGDEARVLAKHFVPVKTRPEEGGR